MYDELELDKLGDRKTALFLIMSDTDSTFNFLISMIYTRTLNDEQILVVCNFTDHDVPCPLLNDWQNTELLISNYNTPGTPGSLRPFEAVVYRK